MAFKLPDHADRRKASNDAKQALLDKLKARKSDKATPAPDKKSAK
ncbi:hypothetical protein [Pelagibacterium sp.]